uniref:Uncharacterized protein n=1 Tax=Eutreptiella gymnastica TaxID=73025 RepID=A0A7S1NH50_9EUGL|mmetsp:Transcript_345/g.820  ORF Transcript_345/g.820 Transcript_345/m.820 type:complete len:116 (+) Transcript_345:178-525(+)
MPEHKKNVERVDEEGLTKPEAKIYLAVSAAHYKCMMHDEDASWVIKDNNLTYPMFVSLSQYMNSKHAVGAVHLVGDQFTGTQYDCKSTDEREGLKYSPVKAHETPGGEGRSPAPR